MSICLLKGCNFILNINVIIGIYGILGTWDILGYTSSKHIMLSFLHWLWQKLPAAMSLVLTSWSVYLALMISAQVVHGKYGL